MTSTDTAQEQTRARYPDRTGYVERDGVRVFWEEYGHGEPTIFFLHGWPIAHSRVWKGQIPYFARHAHVITMDARGNGRSDRPLDPRRPCPRRARRGPHRGARCDRHRTRARRGLVARRGSGDPRGRAAPRTRRRPLCARERGGADRRAAHPRRGLRHVRRAAGQLRGRPEDQPPLLGAELSRLRRVLLRPVRRGAAFHEAAGRSHGMGDGHDAGGSGRHCPGDHGVAVAGRGLDEGVLPDAGDRRSRRRPDAGGDRDRGGRGNGRRAARYGGRRAQPAGACAGAVQPGAA